MIVLFHNYFSPSGEQPKQCISAYKSETNCWLYSDISQILLLYETWEYYNKFDSTKSLRVCYWYVKISQCGKMEHGLEYIMFYVEKHIAPLAVCCGPLLVHDKPLGVLHLWDLLICMTNKKINHLPLQSVLIKPVLCNTIHDILNLLTHWGQVMHICLGNLNDNIIASNNGLSPGGVGGGVGSSSGSG